MNPAIGVLILSTILLITNAFFVAAEYALVSVRKTRIETLAKQGHRGAINLLAALESVSRYVASSQIAITMTGIGIGSVTEPFVSKFLEEAMGLGIPSSVRSAISIILVTFVLVVLGELVPKYLSIRQAERIAFFTFPVLSVSTRILSVLVWLAQKAAGIILRPFGVNIEEVDKEGFSRDELVMLVRSGKADGRFEKGQADLVTKALRFDTLDANDIMVHRLDVKWLDLALSKERLFARLKELSFTRLLVCKGDIDEVVGIVYVMDIVHQMDAEEFELAKLVRPAIMIPENLALDRIIDTMRQNKTQILVVMDEYGGTSGIVTLEDVIEEVFGEMEDSLESERPPMELIGASRVSARAEVRYDELISFLNLDLESHTDTLAEMLLTELQRVMKPGDSWNSPLGVMRVENMARSRITRVSIQLSSEISALLLDQPSSSKG